MSLSERLRQMDGHKSPPAVQEEAADEIDRLQGVLDAIDALHFPTTWLLSGGERHGCAHDGGLWPCPTHKLLHPEETE